MRVTEPLVLPAGGPSREDTDMEQTIHANNSPAVKLKMNTRDAKSPVKTKGCVPATLRETLAKKLRQKADSARQATAARARVKALQRVQLLGPIGDRLAEATDCLAGLAAAGDRQHTLHAGPQPLQPLQQWQPPPPAADGGNCYQNLWIVKPAKLSRGRGICVFENMHELLAYCGVGGRADVAQSWKRWVVQKYIERPLTIAGHKWDMRQWVLVASWNPVVVFMFEECYARFAVEAYDAESTTATHNDGFTGGGGGDDEDDEDDDDDPAEQKRRAKKAAKIREKGGFVHLVNNSVSKYSKNFNKTFAAEDGQIVKGHMWNNKQLAQYLQWHSSQKGGKQPSGDIYTTKVKPAMQSIVNSVIKCSLGRPERENSWEIFGFDFFIDEAYQPWLIEINSSPAVDYSTSVTEEYCSRGLVEGVNVALEWKPWWLQLRQKHQSAVAASETSSKKSEQSSLEFEAEVDVSGDTEKLHSAPATERPGKEPSMDHAVMDETAADETADSGHAAVDLDHIKGLSSSDWAAEPSTGGWELLTARPDLLNEEIDMEGMVKRPTDLPDVQGVSVRAAQKAIRQRKRQERLAAEQQAAVEKRRANIKRAQQMLEAKNEEAASSMTSIFLRGDGADEPGGEDQLVEQPSPPVELKEQFDHRGHNHYRTAFSAHVSPPREPMSAVVPIKLLRVMNGKLECGEWTQHQYEAAQAAVQQRWQELQLGAVRSRLDPLQSHGPVYKLDEPPPVVPPTATAFEGKRGRKTGQQRRQQAGDGEPAAGSGYRIMNRHAQLADRLMHGARDARPPPTVLSTELFPSPTSAQLAKTKKLMAGGGYASHVEPHSAIWAGRHPMDHDSMTAGRFAPARNSSGHVRKADGQAGNRRESTSPGRLRTAPRLVGSDSGLTGLGGDGSRRRSERSLGIPMLPSSLRPRPDLQRLDLQVNAPPALSCAARSQLLTYAAWPQRYAFRSGSGGGAKLTRPTGLSRMLANTSR